MYVLNYSLKSGEHQLVIINNLIILRDNVTYIFFFVVIGLLSSCNATKYVPENKYLLNKNEIKTSNGQVNKDEIKNYIRQKPNKKIFGIKFHLSLYNLSKKEKDNGFNRWLRSIGEEPVIYDEHARYKTRSQLELYLKNKGYYNSVVQDTTFFEKRKASNLFYLTLNEPYLINNISYEFEDAGLAPFVFSDTTFSLIRKGDFFDVDILSEERERIETLLRNKGFYNFYKEYIYFKTDSSFLSHRVDVSVVFKKYREESAKDQFHEIPHPRYKIRDIYININYQPGEVLSNNKEYFASLDTIEAADNIFITYTGSKPDIKPSVVISSCYLIPGQYYQIFNVNRTYQRLSSLQIFRLITFNFKEFREEESSERFLDCHIELTKLTLQSFAIELEGTNSSGNIGAAGNLIYQNRNLFVGAENFDMRLKGAVETIKETRDYHFGNMVESGIEASIRFPKFLVPFRSDQLVKQFRPYSKLSMAYNYQRRPDYARTVANAALSYNWKGNPNLTHIVSPMELSFIKIPYKSKQFIDWLEGKYIYYSYQPHLVAVSSYSAIFSNQNIQKTKDFMFVRFNAESAGNILYSVYKIGGVDDSQGNYSLFNIDFAQFIRGDIDIRFFNFVDENNSFAYRVFAGAGLPYSNSTALPFEKRYFSGGANSIRAWQVRNLGPGSFRDTSMSHYPNQTADIKLEVNFEYRFKMFWLLEGAVFVDAGNIWAITKNDERQGALFQWNKFYKDIAIGSGFGARFDFSFFIFRLDLGVRTRDPAIDGDNKWVLLHRKLTRNDFTLNLGIGYPF